MTSLTLTFHFLNPDSLLNVMVFVALFICPDMILVIIGPFVADNFFSYSVFYVFSGFGGMLLRLFVTVVGLFSFYMFTIDYFLVNSLLMSL